MRGRRRRRTGRGGQLFQPTVGVLNGGCVAAGWPALEAGRGGPGPERAAAGRQRKSPHETVRTLASSSAMAGLDFTDQDIQEQLSLLGYHNVPHHQLQEFRKDLEELIKHEYGKTQVSSKASSESCVSQMRKSSIQHPILATQATTKQDSDKENQFSYKKETFHGYSTEFHQSDAYTRYMVAPNVCGSTLAPCKFILQKSLDQESNGSQMQSENSRTSTPDMLSESNRKPIIKRKVLRKKNGQLHVYDESTITETDSDAGSELGEKISRFQVFNKQESHTENEEFRSVPGRRPNSAQLYLWSQKLLDEGYGCHPNAPKSFIRPIMDHPHTRNLKKTDPVAKYFEYKRNWEIFKTPGEKDRKELRWEIREQMLYRSQLPPKPQHLYVPNDYVVPTEKKRSALRWQIRHELAGGTIPQKFFCL
ncbi:centriolar and ciliogenesis-associated protein HYLS1 [Narcine bancroftii]|uniref:centriolar and ciliogenesis-associated protein HYLS1 n=1 Tax=Narcine bancroftii TaxID=1343680 RepID=UPI0038321C93